MWPQFFLGFIGICSGLTVSGGVVGLLIGLSIIPRFAGITHTSDHILLYEDATMLGTVLGNLIFLFQFSLPMKTLFFILYGTFSGIFLGGWILALTETADIFPIVSRRIRLKQGIPLIIISVALGKLFGALSFYYLGW